MTNKLEQQTVLDFQRGTEQAMKTVFDAHFIPLLLFIEKFTGRRDEAEDIAICTFQSLFQRHDQFNNEVNIRAFLYVSARNRSFTYLKTKKDHSDHNRNFAARMQDDTLLEYEYTIKPEIMKLVHNAVENLPDECRRIFKLLYYEELTPVEIGNLLQISLSTIYTQRNRALAKIRYELSGLEIS